MESLQIGVVVASASASKAISKEKSKTKIEGVTRSSMRLRAHSHDGRMSTAISDNSLLHNISSSSSSISLPPSALSSSISSELTSSSGSEMQSSKVASSAVGAYGGENEAEVVSVIKPPIARASRTRAHSHDDRLVTIADTHKRSNRKMNQLNFLDIESIKRRYNSKKVNHNMASRKLFNAILQENSKSNPHFPSRILIELGGFNTSDVQELFNIFNIDRNMEETKKFKSDVLISVFTDGFIKKYSLVNSHIGNFDMFL